MEPSTAFRQSMWVHTAMAGRSRATRAECAGMVGWGMERADEVLCLRQPSQVGWRGRTHSGTSSLNATAGLCGGSNTAVKPDSVTGKSKSNKSQGGGY